MTTIYFNDNQIKNISNYLFDLSKAVVIASWLTTFNGDVILVSITFFQLSFGLVLLLAGVVFSSKFKEKRNV